MCLHFSHISYLDIFLILKYQQLFLFSLNLLSHHIPFLLNLEKRKLRKAIF